MFRRGELGNRGYARVSGWLVLAVMLAAPWAIWAQSTGLEFLQEPQDVAVAVGESNTANLTAATLNQRILAFTIEQGVPPFQSSGVWHLALDSGTYYLGKNSGPGFSTGQWGLQPSQQGSWLILSNLPVTGQSLKIEVKSDGRYQLFLDTPEINQTGTVRMLGPRRPAKAVFTAEGWYPHPDATYAYEWQKEGKQIVTVPAGTDQIQLPSINLSVPGMLEILDVQPVHAGQYRCKVTVRKSQALVAEGFSRTALLVTQGPSLELAPQFNAAERFGSSGSDDTMAAYGAVDGGGVMAATLEGGFTVANNNLAAGTYLLKITPDGVLGNAWIQALPKTVTYDESTVPIRAIQPDGQGGSYIAGMQGGRPTWFLNRVNPQGITSWTQSVTTAGVGGAYNAVGTALGVVQDGIVAAGNFNGTIRFGATNYGGPAVPPSGGVVITNLAVQAAKMYLESPDIFITKYSTQGQLAWVQQFGSTNEDRVNAIAVDPAGGIYAGGFFQGEAQFGTLHLTSSSVVSGGVAQYGKDGFVVKLNAQGVPIWVKKIGEAGADGVLYDTVIENVSVDQNGVVTITGKFNHPKLTLQPGLVLNPAEYRNEPGYSSGYFMAQLNPDGTPLWARLIKGAWQIRLHQDSAGNLYLASLTPITTGSAVLYPHLEKLQANGVAVWSREFGQAVSGLKMLTPMVRSLGVDAQGNLEVFGRLTMASSTIAEPRAAKFDNFTLQSSNVADTGDLFFARLPAHFAASAPMILSQPLSVRVVGPTNIQFTVTWVGSSPMNMQWFFNQAPIAGATNETYNLGEVNSGNVNAYLGGYFLVLSNQFGAVTSRVAEVMAALGISNNLPAVQVVRAGQDIQLNIAVIGAQPVYYQWQFNGSPMPLQTNANLWLRGVGLAQDGLYQVVISNRYDQVTSEVCHVSVRLASQLDESFTGPASVNTGTGLIWYSGGLAGYDLTPFTVLPANYDDFNGEAGFPTTFSRAVQLDGKVLVAGNFLINRKLPNGRIVSWRGIERLLADGKADTNFYPGWGPVFAANEYETQVDQVVVQPDEKILIAGHFDMVAGQLRTNLARLNSDGSLDTNFNVGAGPLIVDATFPQGQAGKIQRIACQSDGKILVAGYFNQFSGYKQTQLVRLHSDGRLDTNFGVYFRTTPSVTLQNLVLLVQPDHKIVTGSYNLVRVNADGTLDATFATPNEFLKNKPGSKVPINMVALQPNGRLLVAASHGLFRVETNGLLDSNFVTRYSNSVTRVAVYRDGRILVESPNPVTDPGDGYYYGGFKRLVGDMPSSGPIAIDPPYLRLTAKPASDAQHRVVFAWPAYAGYVLEAADTLPSGFSTQRVESVTSLVNGRYETTLNPVGRARYFRLRFVP